jgi:hypothetical protein
MDVTCWLPDELAGADVVKGVPFSSEIASPINSPMIDIAMTSMIKIVVIFWRANNKGILSSLIRMRLEAVIQPPNDTPLEIYTAFIFIQ